MKKRTRDLVRKCACVDHRMSLVLRVINILETSERIEKVNRGWLVSGGYHEKKTKVGMVREKEKLSVKLRQFSIIMCTILHLVNLSPKALICDWVDLAHASSAPPVSHLRVLSSLAFRGASKQ
jgi:hypothetical protein